MAGTQDGDYREMDLNNGVIWSDRKHHMWFPISFTKYSIKDGRLYISEGCISVTLTQTASHTVKDFPCNKQIISSPTISLFQCQFHQQFIAMVFKSL